MLEDHKPMLIYGGRDDENWRKERIIQALGKIEPGSIPPIRWIDDFKGRLYVGIDCDTEEHSYPLIVDAALTLRAAWLLIGENLGGIVYKTSNYPERTREDAAVCWSYIDEYMRDPENSFEDALHLDFPSVEW